MPVYEYRRDDTDEMVEVSMTVAEMLQQQREDDHGEFIWWDIYANEVDFDYHGAKTCVKAYREYTTPSKGRLSSTYPMVSNTMGCHPKQVKEFERLSREAGVPTNFTKAGDPILTSHTHRKKYAESRGFYDLNGGYSDPQQSGK